MAFRYADVLARWAERTVDEQTLHTTLVMQVIMQQANIDHLRVSFDDMVRGFATHTVKVNRTEDGSFIIHRVPRETPLELPDNEEPVL